MDSFDRTYDRFSVAWLHTYQKFPELHPAHCFLEKPGSETIAWLLISPTEFIRPTVGYAVPVTAPKQQDISPRILRQDSLKAFALLAKKDIRDVGS